MADKYDPDEEGEYPCCYWCKAGRFVIRNAIGFMMVERHMHPEPPSAVRSDGQVPIAVCNEHLVFSVDMLSFIDLVERGVHPDLI